MRASSATSRRQRGQQSGEDEQWTAETASQGLVNLIDPEHLSLLVSWCASGAPPDRDHGPVCTGAVYKPPLLLRTSVIAGFLAASVRPKHAVANP